MDQIAIPTGGQPLDPGLNHLDPGLSRPQIETPAAPTTRDEQIDVGRKLIAVKEVLAGEFKRWVEDRCPFSYPSAANYMKAAREAALTAHVEAARKFTSAPATVSLSNDRRVDLNRFADLMGMSRDGSWCRSPQNVVSYLVRHLPRLSASTLAEGLRGEIAYRELATTSLKAALEIVTALPPDSLPALSEAGRGLDVRDPVVKALAEGSAESVRLRVAAENAHLEATRRCWSIMTGQEQTNAEVADFLRGGGQINLPPPIWPADDAELAAYVAALEAEIAPTAKATNMGQLLSCWDYERLRAGQARGWMLPPAEGAELARRLSDWIDRGLPWEDMTAIYWPNIPAPPSDGDDADE